jgi:hypothetical protein
MTVALERDVVDPPAEELDDARLFGGQQLARHRGEVGGALDVSSPHTRYRAGVVAVRDRIGRHGQSGTELCDRFGCCK